MITQKYGDGVAAVTSNTAKLAVGDIVSASILSDVNAIAGETDATFEVKASGSGTFSYQWYKNTTGSNQGGEPIDGANSNTYTIPANNVTTDLNGTYYYVEVTQSYGEDTNTVTSEVAALNVIAKAEITINPQPVTVYENVEDIVFEVEASGDGTLIYQWYKNDTNSNEGGEAIPGAVGNTYTIPKEEATSDLDGTYYYVVVTQKYGTATTTVTTEPVLLTVTRTSIEASETDVTVYVNGNSKTVTLSGENAGTFSIQTPADGVHATAEINPGNNSELIITPMAIGGTSVIIEEGNGEKTVIINIEVKGTTITAKPTSVIAYVGGNGQTVTLGGENTEGFIVETEPDNKVATASISGNTLTIEPLGVGTASVVVKETNGNKTTTVNVEVKGTTITADKTNVTVYVGGSKQTVTLGGENAGTFIVESNSNGAVATAEINPENNKELIITAEAAGTTSIVVKEQNGNKEITIDVDVYEPQIEVSAEEVVVYVGGDAQTVTLGGDYVGKFSVTSNTSEETATAEINPSNSNELIITPVGAGTTTITLTESNGNKTIPIEVEVKTTTMAEVGKVTAYVGGNPQEIPITGTNLGDLSIDQAGTTLDESIADVSINNDAKTVSITAKEDGNTGVTIKEGNGKKTITIQIEVKESSIIVDGTAILYFGGESKTLSITGENMGDISIEESEEGIVKTQLQDKTSLTISPIAVGNTTLTLKESNGNQTATVEVKVLATSITPQTIEVYEGGNAKTVAIEGLNLGTVTIETPADGTYATAEINPDNNKELIVTPVKAGNTSIELKESNGNATATINIIVLTTTITADPT